MKKRITPESQKTRLPFSLVLLIALIGVILLGCAHSIGHVTIYGIGAVDILRHDIDGNVAAMHFSELLINVVSFLLSDTIPLILCALCVIMALSMMKSL